MTGIFFGGRKKTLFPCKPTASGRTRIATRQARRQILYKSWLWATYPACIVTDGFIKKQQEYRARRYIVQASAGLFRYSLNFSSPGFFPTERKQIENIPNKPHHMRRKTNKVWTPKKKLLFLSLSSLDRKLNGLAIYYTNHLSSSSSSSSSFSSLHTRNAFISQGEMCRRRYKMELALLYTILYSIYPSNKGAHGG